MKKLIPIILILSLLLTLIPAAADAPTTVMEVYNCNEYVSLREKPDTKSKVLEKVYKGNLVYFCGEAAAGFYHVEFCGQDGYILSKYLKGTEYHESVVIEPNQQVYNVKEWASMRKEPDTKSARIQQVPLGAIVTRCLIGDEGWMLCTYNGKTGYIKIDYLIAADYDKIKKEAEKQKKEEEEASRYYPTTPYECMQVINVNDWVSLRESPDANSKRLAEIPLGEYVTDCLFVNADWVHVYYGELNGYVNAKYLMGSILPEKVPTGFDELPALPPCDAFMEIGSPVCEATFGGYHIIARRAYALAAEQLLAVCYDSANKPLWTAFEVENNIGELETTSAFIAGTKTAPCLVTFHAGTGFTARAIDEKGTILWRLECPPDMEDNTLPGGGLTAAVGEDGTIYAIGFYNANPTAIDNSGHILWQGQNPDTETIYWPYELTVTPAALAVRYDSAMDLEDKDYMAYYDFRTGICLGYIEVEEPVCEEDE